MSPNGCVGLYTALIDMIVVKLGFDALLRATWHDLAHRLAPCVLGPFVLPASGQGRDCFGKIEAAVDAPMLGEPRLSGDCLGRVLVGTCHAHTGRLGGAVLLATCDAGCGLPARGGRTPYFVY